MKKILSGLLAISLAVLVGCAASVPPAVGVWSVEMNTPLGALPATLSINQDGTGLMTAEGLGEAAIDGIMFDGNSMSFETAVDVQGQSLVLEFNGEVTGDSVSGAFGSDFGDFAVTGSRQ